MKEFLAVCIGLVMIALPVMVLGKKTFGNIGKLILALLGVIILFIAYVMTK